jgi:LCP family protein required for cell wall assembly
MEDVPFPASSPLHKAFPNGYGCPDHSCMLNAVYTYAASHPDLYPGVKNPGAQATKEAIEGATGLKINYYALIDLQGFQKLIDAVGGITLTVNTRLPIGGQVPGQKVKNYIEPGTQHMDGFHALWYARSRHADSDYARMARQKCVMNAMLNQLDPVTVLTKFNKIATAGRQIVETDVPPKAINQLIGLAGKAKQHKIASVAFVPPAIYPGSPDFGLMHRMVTDAVNAATDAGAAKAKAARQAAKQARQQARQQSAQQPAQQPAQQTAQQTGTSSANGASSPSAAGRPSSGSSATPSTQGSTAGQDRTSAEKAADQDLGAVCSA